MNKEQVQRLRDDQELMRIVKDGAKIRDDCMTAVRRDIHRLVDAELDAIINKHQMVDMINAFLGYKLAEYFEKLNKRMEGNAS